MDTPRKLIVGYDLCEDFTQISCYSYKASEPITIGVQDGAEDHKVPTVLCLKTETKQWLFGEEAIAYAADSNGVLIDHLLTKVQTKEETEFLDHPFSAVDLLSKFLQKTLTLVKNYFPTEQITRLVVTVRDFEPYLVGKIYEALAMLGLEKDRAVVMSHAGAYLYYALSQDRSLWMNDVGLFDFSKEGLKYYQISINRRTKPMIAGLTIKDFTDTLNDTMLMYKESNSAQVKNPAYIFENIANTALYKQIVTTLYFTGCGFENGFAQDIIKSLCVGRRVFYGQNLFTKGACYAAKELSGDRNLEDFILLSDDMITRYIFIRVYCDTAFKEVPLLEAGESWFEVNRSVEVIAEQDAELEIIIKNIMTRDVSRQTIKIDPFPQRPDRMTRLSVNLTCQDKTTALITVTDLGFGEIYPEAGKLMEFTIDIV